MTDNDLQQVIATLKDRGERTRKELAEYIRAEKVLIAAGHVSEEVIRQAHELVRNLP